MYQNHKKRDIQIEPKIKRNEKEKWIKGKQRQLKQIQQKYEEKRREEITDTTKLDFQTNL